MTTAIITSNPPTLEQIGRLALEVYFATERSDAAIAHPADNDRGLANYLSVQLLRAQTELNAAIVAFIESIDKDSLEGIDKS